MFSSITHLPHNQGNLVAALQYGERKLGAKSISISAPNPFVDLPDIPLPQHHWRKLQTLSAYRKARKSSIVAFNYGSSLLDTPSRHTFLLDLPFYPIHQKKMMFYQGSDARIKYTDIILESREHEKSLGYDIKDITNDGFISADEIDLKLRRAAKVDKYIDRLFFLNPDLAQGLPDGAKFLPYPHFCNSQTVSDLGEIKRPLRVLHLSTNRVLKGTGLIEKALKIAQKNISIEVKVCVRVSRSEAMAALNWADVLIDQVGIGWYGMQAVEALSRGKIVICSIDKNHWEKYCPDYVDKPSGIIHSHYKDLSKVLIELSESSNMRHTLSSAGPNFVKDVHDPIKVVQANYGDWINGHR